jgi:ABC-type Fe3+-siderophore transport system permease subunit
MKEIAADKSRNLRLSVQTLKDFQPVVIRCEWTKGLGAVSVVLLAGSSVAISGSIGFVGLVLFCPIAWMMARDLNAFNPGDEIARGLGSPVEWRRGRVTHD